MTDDAGDAWVMRDPHSLAAYRDLVDSGALSRVQMLTYRTLCSYLPLTAQELVLLSAYKHAEKRTSELEDMGLIRKGEPRKCRETGRVVWTWEVVENPGPIPDEKPKRESLAKRVETLQLQVLGLQQRVRKLENPYCEPRQTSLF